ncbi:hypothetical protein M3Y97_00183400 [Aphelenchoides bicaudatus]|nr:hypothetical protein M3Y97_00183400 [Aphelenchoides bicaudatus]
MIIDGMDGIHDGRHDQRHERDSGDSIFFEVMTGVARKSPTGFRFNRLMDDFTSISSFLKDIRICLIALTILIYCVLIGYLVQKCVEHRRKSTDGRRQWDFQAETPAALECRNQSTQLDLVSVRSDGQVGNATNTNSTLPPASIGQNSYINRNHRSSTPSMMRHNRHQFSLGHEIGNGAKGN